ncbi:cytokinin hydroxylase [Cryptomeria japonica]|uniref:cytokinin hydroxylase n=1 Tax=Cryptomeria japonica TaxID=3369 RepID=UPI0027DA034A|nr:cytokinin hydroxylase [Cryptomeria japonica]
MDVLLSWNGTTITRDSSERKKNEIFSSFLWSLAGIPLVLFGLVMIMVVVDFLMKYWVRPRVMKWRMARQGVFGPTPSFMMGNLREMEKMKDEETSNHMQGVRHDIVSRLLPHYVRWSKLYGKRFIFWWGIEPRMSVTEPDLIKEILCSKHSLYYGKSYLQQRGVRDFIGKGLVMANGESWAHQRRVVAPAFSLEKIKSQVQHMVDSTLEMSDRWKGIVDGGGGSAEVEVSKDFSCLAGDIIARSIFGRNFEEGRKIFQQLTSLQKLSSQAGRYQWLPISRFLLVSVNSKIRKLKFEVENSLQDIIQARVDEYEEQKKSYGDDLLGLMLSQAYEGKSKKLRMQQVIDECKTFFFAGHDTTAMLLAWTMMLLASNPSWQEKARNEILTVCGTDLPDIDSLANLKIVGMIVNESLRLYTPASLLARQAQRDMKIGGLRIPKGLSVWIPTLAIHHDKEIWGTDADEFKPQRFAEGVAKACKHPMGFLPFSYGPRSCVGQNYTLMETKLVLALILTRFSFRLSPNYKHAPVFVLTLKPKHGVHLILENYGFASPGPF